MTTTLDPGLLSSYLQVDLIDADGERRHECSYLRFDPISQTVLPIGTDAADGSRKGESHRCKSYLTLEYITEKGWKINQSAGNKLFESILQWDNKGVDFLSRMGYTVIEYGDDIAQQNASAMEASWSRLAGIYLALKHTDPLRAAWFSTGIYRCFANALGGSGLGFEDVVIQDQAVAHYKKCVWPGRFARDQFSFGFATAYVWDTNNLPDAKPDKYTLPEWANKPDENELGIHYRGGIVGAFWSRSIADIMSDGFEIASAAPMSCHS